jgi:hypothetical protein
MPGDSQNVVPHQEALAVLLANVFTRISNDEIACLISLPGTLQMKHASRHAASGLIVLQDMPAAPHLYPACCRVTA